MEQEKLAIYKTSSKPRIQGSKKKALGHRLQMNVNADCRGL